MPNSMGCFSYSRGSPNLAKPAPPSQARSRLLTLSPPAGGRGQGEGGRRTDRVITHLTLPLRGPLPLPPEGRRGILATAVLQGRSVDCNHELHRLLHVLPSAAN